MNLPPWMDRSHKAPKAGGVRRESQQGVVLVMGILLLLVLTILGFSSMKTTSTQNKTAVHHQGKALTVQAAEYGLAIVAEKVAAGCRASANCSLKIYSGSASDFNLTNVPNAAGDSKAFWALNSELGTLNAAGEMEVEIIGVAKDSINASTNTAQSVFKAVFVVASTYGADIFSGAHLHVDVDDDISITGSIQAPDHIKLGGSSSTDVSVSQVNYESSTNVDCTSTQCPASILNLLTTPMGAPATVASAIPTGTVVNCTTATWTNLWVDNATLICNSNVTITSNVSVSLSNFKLRINGTLDVSANQFRVNGSNNLIATTGDMTINTGKNPLNLTGNFQSDKKIKLESTSSSGITLVGTLAARENIDIKGKKFFSSPHPGATSGGTTTGTGTTFQVKSWQQLS